MKTYKRKSNGVIVQAFEFTGKLEEIPESERNHIFVNEDASFFTEHPNNRQIVPIGCILVKRASGYLYPFTKEQFEAQYEEISTAELVENDGN